VVGYALERDSPLRFPAFFGNWNGLFTLQIIGCERIFCGGEIFCRTAVKELAAGDATAGPDVHKLIGCPYNGFLVLHDEEGVAFVPKVLHDLDEA
jgi:hypothetical protein